MIVSATEALSSLETTRDGSPCPSLPCLTAPSTSSSNPGSHYQCANISADADEETALGIRRMGRYPVGYGGFSDVWKATMTDKGGTTLMVALKVLRLVVSDDRLRKREKREMTWMSLHHDNVAPLYHAFHQPNGSPVFVSQWYENGTVNSYLRQHPAVNPMPIIFEIACGIEYLHGKGIVHGDLKGSNVLVDDDGHARLIDFGLCRSMDCTSGLTTSNNNTSRWCAPELFSSNDPRPTMSSDVYAFASTVLELLTKDVPYGMLNDRLVPLQILRHVTPRSHSHGFQYNIPRTAELWVLLDECWAKFCRRPRIHEVLLRLSYIYL